MTEQMVEIVRRALAEDAPWGDITSDTLIPAGTRARGRIVAREACVVSGIDVVLAVFAEVDRSVFVDPLVADGEHVAAGATIADVEGEARSLLRAERVALNFLQRLSGIATLTAAFVAEVAAAGSAARITDTRKTTPGLRFLERAAVRAGGGVNHRFSLSDAVLVKDNHLVALARAGIDLADALRAARTTIPHTVRIEVEVDRADQIYEVLAAGADAVLVDNMSIDEMRQAVEKVAGRAIVEASGGVRVDTVRAIAGTGVDVISAGALTHSARAIDIALDLDIGGDL